MTYPQRILAKRLNEIKVQKAKTSKGSKDRRLVVQYEQEVKHALRVLALQGNNQTS